MKCHREVTFFFVVHTEEWELETLPDSLRWTIQIACGCDMRCSMSRVGGVRVK